MEIGHNLNHVGLIAHGLNAIQLRAQGGEGIRVSLFLIGAGRPVVSDFPLDRGALGGWLRRYFEYGLVEEGLVPQLQLPEGIPEHFIGGNRIVGDPAIARVRIEIGARIDRCIDHFRIEVIKLRSRFSGVLRWRCLAECRK
jgi:hypothetical protein